MKKAILGTTALVAVSALAVGNVSAADKIKLSVGGYMQSTYYYANYDNDRGSTVSNANLKRISDRVTQEGEIFFTGSTTLDNGLKFGVNVQLEAYEATDQVDETYIFIQGSFGRVLLGSEDSAAYLMHYTGPSPVPMYSADSANINPIGTGNSTRPTLFSDSDKITYFTPRFAGFQLGASYVPDGSSQTGITAGGTFSVYNATAIEGGVDQGYSVAANYVNKFGGVDVAASAGYQSADTAATSATGGGSTETTSEYSFGTQVGFAGFTVGGGYRKQSDVGGNADRKTWTAGAKYGMGPWSVGVQYSDQSRDVIGGNDLDLTNWVIGGQYTLGPGITAFGGVEIYDNDIAGSATSVTGKSQIYFVGTALSF